MSHIPGCTVPVLDFKNLRAPNETVLGVINGKGLENLTPDSDGIIYFTSGTTGFPKAVLSTQRAGLHNYIASYIRTSPRHIATNSQPRCVPRCGWALRLRWRSCS